jgi:4a-hydroxytetrahydrobiopterin dehydratase
MWQVKNNFLYKKFEFKDFKQAFDFMTKVTRIVEEQSHHPKWQNEWNEVEIWLNTHEAGGKITDKDYDLAQAIERIYKEYKK